jgi:AGCS family alanine or glycine:cation symporter
MFVENLTEFILAVNDWLYQPAIMPLVLLVVGAWLTVRSGFVQFRRFPLAVKRALGGVFKRTTTEGGTITPFQALSTALAATVGNGNIGGVATAILLGGPGSIFWMWVCATAGMATKYAEAVLGVHFRVTRETGELASGPMYYIQRGVPHKKFGKVLAILFAIFGTATALFGTGNMMQSNTIARTAVEAVRSTIGLEISQWIPGAFITLAVGLVLLGGIKRIAKTAEALVPTMIVIYLCASVGYLLWHITDVPGVFATIFQHAFTPHAAVGGFVGASFSAAIGNGISRGILSNEAGLGSAPIAHGIADVKHPCQQGTVGVFEVFVDTIVVCSLTAFVIIQSGLWTQGMYQDASGDLTAAAMSTTIPFASVVVALASLLFGFSTLIAWCYYGEKCIEFVFGSWIIKPYKIVFVVLIMLGSFQAVDLVFALGTTFNGFMAFPNLIGLAFLGGTVAKLTTEYFSNPEKYE